MSVRVALAQIRGAPFAAAENRALTVETAAQAFAEGADVVVLPELIVSGYALDARACARRLTERCSRRT